MWQRRAFSPSFVASHTAVPLAASPTRAAPASRTCSLPSPPAPRTEQRTCHQGPSHSTHIEATTSTSLLYLHAVKVVNHDTNEEVHDEEAAHDHKGDKEEDPTGCVVSDRLHVDICQTIMRSSCKGSVEGATTLTSIAALPTCCIHSSVHDAHPALTRRHFEQCARCVDNVVKILRQQRAPGCAKPATHCQ